MATAFALISTSGRFLGGALYESRAAAEEGLAWQREEMGADTAYDGIVELHYEEPWATEAAAAPQPLASAGN